MTSRVPPAVRVLLEEMAKFGVVGAVNFVFDVLLFNALVLGPLADKPLTAKTLSTLAATTSSYFMNRHWTFRGRVFRGAGRELPVFVVLSGIGLGITVGCLAVSEYVLGYDSLLARNIAGNVVGTALGMVWRFWSFRRWVFREQPREAADAALTQSV